MLEGYLLQLFLGLVEFKARCSFNKNSTWLLRSYWAGGEKTEDLGQAEVFLRLTKLSLGGLSILSGGRGGSLGTCPWFWAVLPWPWYKALHLWSGGRIQQLCHKNPRKAAWTNQTECSGKAWRAASFPVSRLLVSLCCICPNWPTPAHPLTHAWLVV